MKSPMRSRLTTLLASLLLAQAALAQPVVSTAVQEAVKDGGTVRVMIAFDVPALRGPAAAQLGSPQAAAAIQAVGADIEVSFAPGEFAVAHRYSHVNALAGEVGQAGLTRLLAHPAVLRVDIDEGGAGIPSLPGPFPPALPEPFPLALPGPFPLALPGPLPLALPGPFPLLAQASFPAAALVPFAASPPLPGRRSH